MTNKKMKTVIIIGGTREAARERLNRIARDDGVVHREWHDEATVDGCRIVAVGGEPEDECFLRGAGFADVEIITVGAGISEAMWRCIRHVRSTATVYFYVEGKRRERQLIAAGNMARGER